MAVTQTEADFEQMSWHDCHIWRIEFRVGEPEDDDWTSDLVLGLDFILEWLCGVDGSATFKIAPATLVFHGVTDPKIAIDLGDNDLQSATSPSPKSNPTKFKTRRSISIGRIFGGRSS